MISIPESGISVSKRDRVSTLVLLSVLAPCFIISTTIPIILILYSPIAFICKLRSTGPEIPGTSPLSVYCQMLNS
jgi:hypothetical protein